MELLSSRNASVATGLRPPPLPPVLVVKVDPPLGTEEKPNRVFASSASKTSIFGSGAGDVYGLMPSNEQRGKYIQALRSIDKDGDGQVTRAEAMGVFVKSGLTCEVLDAIFAVADLSNDNALSVAGNRLCALHYCCIVLLLY